MTLHDLPALNATLNGTAAILLVIGLTMIKQGKRQAHKRVMIAAFTVSSLFLISYLIYHFQVGSVHYPHTGMLRNNLFRDSGHAHHPGRHRPVSGHHHFAARAEIQIRAAQKTRPVDAAHLAVRERHRRDRLPDALSVLITSNADGGRRWHWLIATTNT